MREKGGEERGGGREGGREKGRGETLHVFTCDSLSLAAGGAAYPQQMPPLPQG